MPTELSIGKKVEWTASGGFVGPAWPERHVLDILSMPAAWQAQWQTLVVQSDFFAPLPDACKAAPRSADFLYSLEIQDGPKQHRVQFHLGVNPALDALLQYLQQH